MITLILSAFCYIFPFWCPTAWPIIFLFPTFLMCSFRNSIFVYSAILWGLLISIGHIIPIAQALFCMSTGSALMRSAPGALLIIMLAAYSSSWLWITALARSFYLHIASIWFFLMSIDQALFAPFGAMHGLVFMNPIIVLPPFFLHLLPHVGMAATLGFFCITSACIYLWFTKKIPLLILLCSCIPWIFSAVLKQKNIKNNVYRNIAYLPIMIPKKCDESLILKNLLSYIQKQHPHISILLIPESACPQPPHLNTSINLILGTFEEHSNTRSNSACWIANGTHCLFRKQYPIAFGEYIPTWLHSTFFTQLLFSTAKPIRPSRNARPRWKLHDDLTVVPYICSELFCTNTPHDAHRDPIIALCNDWWFALPHYRQLLARAARLRAIQWQRPIIYASYYHGQFFDEFGSSHPLERI